MNLSQLQDTPRLAPTEELGQGSVIGPAGVIVVDAAGEVFHEEVGCRAPGVLHQDRNIPLAAGE